MSAPLPLETDCATAKARLDRHDDFVLLDVREQDEYDVANIAGARLLPMSQLVDRIAELAGDRQRNIIVHCHHGARSLRVVKYLRDQGFDRAQSLAGGIDEWSRTIDQTVPQY